MEKVNQRFSCFSRYTRKRGFVFLVLGLVMCGFVVGASYSEIETSFVIKGPEVVDEGLDFWVMYGDYLVAGIIVFVAVVIYLNAIKRPKKRHRK